MTIKAAILQLATERSDLEARIRKAVSAEVDAFQQATGMQVEGVSVSMVTVSTIGAPPERVVSSVEVGLRVG